MELLTEFTVVEFLMSKLPALSAGNHHKKSLVRETDGEEGL